MRSVLTLPFRAVRKAAELAAFLLLHPSEARYLASWAGYRLRRRSPMDEGMPFVSLRARAWLRGALHPDSRVFEYGSGGSSIFYCGLAASVVSVEHDAAWFETGTAIKAARGLDGWTLLLRGAGPPVPGDPADTDSYASLIKPGDYRDYASAIDDYPDGTFDLVMVDGRARPSCAAHGAAKVRPGGYLVLDDYDREYYRNALRLFAAWEQTDLTGLVPYHWGFHHTIAWRKPLGADA